ncbi:MAG: hypothetical protein J5851_07060, partial [Oscillospiraceae bacterium]|nr:hypothetical protein [Oscillospiraceae bacterium]
MRKTKKVLATVLSLLLAGSAMQGMALPVSHAADVSFTHQEWTGKNGAEDVFAVNRVQATCNPVPFQSTEAACNAVWDYNAREDSDYLQMLTGSGGKWDLLVVQNDERASGFRNAGFMNPSYSPSGSDNWKSVSLPDSWTR